MVKRILTNSLLNFVRLIGTLAISMILVIMVLGLVIFVFGNIGVAVLRTLLFCAISFGGLFYMNSQSAYKNSAPVLSETVLSGVLMTIYHILIAKLLKFVMYTSGAAYYAIQSYYLIIGQEIPDMYTVPDLTYILLMILFDILYIAAIYLGGQHGARKRQRDREQLTGRTSSI